MSSTYLKILALIFMTIDHIGAMIPGMPICFRWIGRLSAPIFLFCVIEGMQKTNNRKRFWLRMYLCSIGMAVMNTIINYLMPEQPVLEDDIFFVYVSIMSYVFILEWSLNKFHSIKRGIFLIVAWQLIGELILLAVGFSVIGNTAIYNSLIRVILGCCSSWGENTVFVILGVLLYWTRDNKKSFFLIYILMSFVPSLLRQTAILEKSVGYFLRMLEYKVGMPEIIIFILEYILVLLFSLLGVGENIIRNYAIDDIWMINYQWMMIAAISFFLLYNGKRGKGFKFFFYLYYPLHILLLAFIRLLF